MTKYTCCICHKDFEGYGNNPSPYKNYGRCCDKCNSNYVIPARVMTINQMYRKSN